MNDRKKFLREGEKPGVTPLMPDSLLQMVMEQDRAMNRAAVDYNDIEDSKVLAITKHCDQPPVFGEDILTYDDDGNTCLGRVIFYLDPRVIIKLDIDTWKAGV